MLTSEVRACSSDAHAAKAISAAAFLSGVFVRAIRYDGSRHWLQRFCNFLITLVESGVAATAGCGAGVAVHPAKAAIPNSTTKREDTEPLAPTKAANIVTLVDRLETRGGPILCWLFEAFSFQ